MDTECTLLLLVQVGPLDTECTLLLLVQVGPLDTECTLLLLVQVAALLHQTNKNENKENIFNRDSFPEQTL